jgi:hypothetical protein
MNTSRTMKIDVSIASKPKHSRKDAALTFHIQYGAKRYQAKLKLSASDDTSYLPTIMKFMPGERITLKGHFDMIRGRQIFIASNASGLELALAHLGRLIREKEAASHAAAGLNRQAA